ncbi:hypothetical protein GINT2_001767 [Glugoides intestinalis]
MVGTIKQLIDREKEAEERIKIAQLEMEDVKKKAMQDAELVLNAIQLDYNKKIEKMENETREYLEQMKDSLEKDFNEHSSLINSKNTTVAIEEIIKIITGEEQVIDWEISE